MKYIKYVSSRSVRKADKFNSEYNYLTNSQDIAAVLDYIGLEHMKDDITAIFVLVDDGDYDEIWVTESNHSYYKECEYNKVIHYYKD